MTKYTFTHWGIFEWHKDAAGAVHLVPYRKDADPAAMGHAVGDGRIDRLRIARPAFRKGWLEGDRGGSTRRGRDTFVELDWDRAIELVSGTIAETRSRHGNQSIYAGSYGWASAGRFHHAQSQIHRFFNHLGGYVGHRGNYSYAAASVILPHIVAPIDKLLDQHTSWDMLAEHCELFLAFGGLPFKNSQISSGGATTHRLRSALSRMKNTRFVNISPIRSDLAEVADVEWIPIRPNTDVALILALCFELKANGLQDQAFLERFCVGTEQFFDYLDGRQDGIQKTARWAAGITGIPERRIVDLAADASAHRTMVNASWSVQRAHHGEQPIWAVVALAAMIGQIGTAGGGFGVGYGATNSIGSQYRATKGPTLPQGRNPVEAFIPVARIADMLLDPGGPFHYNGQEYLFPDIKLVYWAGGNPFHHHQDLNRLERAWSVPQTVICHEQYWTPTARRSDIVLPVTTSAERNDIGFAKREGLLVAMQKVTEPFGEARSDFAIFSALADTLGIGSAFAEGLDEMGWLRRLYNGLRTFGDTTTNMPDFDTFWAKGLLEYEPLGSRVMLEEFRSNPSEFRLPTPSGKIELYSERIASMGYDDCPPHPSWIEPVEWLGAETARKYPLHLISNQPEYRLHSQLDHGPAAARGKTDGIERITISSVDAKERGVAQGDRVRLFNDRGQCVAIADISDDIMPGVVKLATGAWYAPLPWRNGRSIDIGGNPNSLTLDIGTSKLAQGPVAQTCLIEVEAIADGALLARSYDPPEFSEA